MVLALPPWLFSDIPTLLLLTSFFGSVDCHQLGRIQVPAFPVLALRDIFGNFCTYSHPLCILFTSMSLGDLIVLVYSIKDFREKSVQNHSLGKCDLNHMNIFCIK